MRSTTTVRLAICRLTRDGQLRPEPALSPETARHRSDPMLGLQREISFLLQISRRLDEFLRLHEAEQALQAHIAEQQLQRRVKPPVQW